MIVWLIILTSVCAVEGILIIHAFIYMGKDKTQDKPSDSLSDNDIKALKQVAEVMSYMGDFGHEDQEDTE